MQSRIEEAGILATLLSVGTALTRVAIEQRADAGVPRSPAVRVHIDILEDEGDGRGMRKVAEVD